MYMHSHVLLYIHSGWLRTVYYHDFGYGNKNCLLKALVNPSQRTSEKPHLPWVAIEKSSGSILTAHCTCMAGYAVYFIYVDPSYDVICCFCC